LPSTGRSACLTTGLAEPVDGASGLTFWRHIQRLPRAAAMTAVEKGGDAPHILSCACIFDPGGIRCNLCEIWIRERSRNSGLLLPNDINNQREYGPKLTSLAKIMCSEALVMLSSQHAHSCTRPLRLISLVQANIGSSSALTDLRSSCMVRRIPIC